MMKQNLFQEADTYRDRLKTARSIPADEQASLDRYFRTGLSYSSNALEGNALTLEETRLLLVKGTVSGEKPLKAYLEVVGHANAYDYMLSCARNPQAALTEDMIKKLHFLFYQKIDLDTAGVYRDMPVYIPGTEYIPPLSEDVPHLMSHFIDQILSSAATLHPIERAAMALKRLLDIHPFTDGNGRTGRLLMNYLLIRDGYSAVSISPDRKEEYVNALIEAQTRKNPDPFIELIGQCVLDTQKDYCRLLKLEG